MGPYDAIVACDAADFAALQESVEGGARLSRDRRQRDLPGDRWLSLKSLILATVRSGGRPGRLQNPLDLGKECVVGERLLNDSVGLLEVISM